MVKLDITLVRQRLGENRYYRDLEEHAAISYIAIMLYNDVALLDMVKDDNIRESLTAAIKGRDDLYRQLCIEVAPILYDDIKYGDKDLPSVLSWGGLLDNILRQAYSY